MTRTEGHPPNSGRPGDQRSALPGSNRSDVPDRPWFFHLDEDSRATLHQALADICEAFDRRNAWSSIQEDPGRGGVILPRAIRIDGRRRATRLNIVELGLSISAPAIRASDRGHLHFVGDTPATFDLSMVPELAARWRDEFGNRDPARRSAAREYDVRLRRIVSGCLELLHLPWAQVWMLLGADGHHSMTVTPPVELQARQSFFSSRPGHPSVGSMSRELVEALDGIVAEGFHVYEQWPGWNPDSLPTARLGGEYSFHMRPQENDPLETMRAIRAVPEGARLIMAS